MAEDKLARSSKVQSRPDQLKQDEVRKSATSSGHHGKQPEGNGATGQPAVFPQHN